MFWTLAFVLDDEKVAERARQEVMTAVGTTSEGRAVSPNLYMHAALSYSWNRILVQYNDIASLGVNDRSRGQCLFFWCVKDVLVTIACDDIKENQ